MNCKVAKVIQKRKIPDSSIWTDFNSPLFPSLSVLSFQHPTPFYSFRECERLKHEVEIWKTVFQANKANLPSDVADNIEDENKTAEKTTDDEVSANY